MIFVKTATSTIHEVSRNFYEITQTNFVLISCGFVDRVLVLLFQLDQKRMLLAKAFRALPDGGAVIVFEALIDDERQHNAFGLLMSLNMLIETPGGFDFTGSDCVGWMRDAGFSETRVEHLVGPDSMVIGFKRGEMR